MAELFSHTVAFLFGYYVIHKNVIKSDSKKVVSILLTLVVFVILRITADIYGYDYYTVGDMIARILESFLYAGAVFLYVRNKTLYEVMHLGKKEPREEPKG